MFRLIELCIAPLIHVGMTWVLLFCLLNNPDILIISILFLLIMLVNVVLTAITAQGKWIVTLTNIALYVIFMILFIIGRNSILEPNHEVEDDYGAGILLLFIGFPLSLISLLIGTLQGVLLSILLREKIESFRKRIYRRLLD
ncbi:hypothetical protein ACFSL6_26175 [Paenibacillus thailandensis]|uniref:Uncharacterized protein n=1 Tax=Paenibacillus thailandensis TaxID=393250 RepID=A0ABW5QRF2_9BACL